MSVENVPISWGNTVIWSCAFLTSLQCTSNLFLIVKCFTACLFLIVLKNIISVSSVSYKTILDVCTRQDPPLRDGPSTIRYLGLGL
jgi:hypothetical protein